MFLFVFEINEEKEQWRSVIYAKDANAYQFFETLRTKMPQLDAKFKREILIIEVLAQRFNNRIN